MTELAKIGPSFVEMAHRFNQRRTMENIRERMRHRLRQMESGKWTWKFDKRFREQDNTLRVGSELSNDFCVTPRLVGVKSGGTLPFRCTAYDPDAKIKSHTLKPDTWYSLPLLWSVSPYEFALSDIAPVKGGGKYSVNLTLQNSGAKTFDKDTVVVALTVYLGDGKVVEFAAATNAASLGPGASEKLTITLDDPGGIGSSHSLSVSVFRP